MPKAATRPRFDKSRLRNWTLYVIRSMNDEYYIGITSRKDFMRRIRQHGGRTGARWFRGKQIAEIVELQHLGKMISKQAENIENDVTLQYRKQFGGAKVRGGYNTMVAKSLIPTYTPGSRASIIFVAGCLLLAVGLLIFIAE